jgi:hypothetical protein
MPGQGDAGCTRTQSCHPWPLAFPGPRSADSTNQTVMSKRVKQLPQERGSVLFDVVYEDGSRKSNRRVPMDILGGLDGDEPARLLIEEQDEAIAQKSGRARSRLQELTRSVIKAPKAVFVDR